MYEEVEKGEEEMKTNKFASTAKGIPEALTQNSAETYATSANPLVDLFFLIGSLSKGNSNRVSANALFNAAFAADYERATRTMLWARDVRGGQGRRQVFRDWLQHIETSQPELCAMLIPFVPVYGRWDDLLVLRTDQMKMRAFRLISEALSAGHGLAAKWMPRKGSLALELARAHFGNMRYRERANFPTDYTLLRRWRRDLARLSKTVEQQMSAKQWTEINYDHVPGLAMTRYRKAFGKHDYLRFGEWLNTLQKKPAKKMNVETLYPFNIVSQLGSPSSYGVSYGPARDKQADALLEEQWKRLPNYVGDAHILPVVDVSASMTQEVQGSTRAIDVSVSLGLYLAEKNTGPFGGLVVNFSDKSELVVVGAGSLRDRANRVAGLAWGHGTNFQAAMQRILDTALKGKVPQEEMPTHLLVISDMEFNSCTHGTNLNEARLRFEQHGYRLPKVVFWNVNGRDRNVPARSFENDIALVSGFSPSIMTAILGVKEFNPTEVMDAAIMKDRYNIWKLEALSVPKA